MRCLRQTIFLLLLLLSSSSSFLSLLLFRSASLPLSRPLRFFIVLYFLPRCLCCCRFGSVARSNAIFILLFCHIVVCRHNHNNNNDNPSAYMLMSSCVVHRLVLCVLPCDGAYSIANHIILMRPGLFCRCWDPTSWNTRITHRFCKYSFCLSLNISGYGQIWHSPRCLSGRVWVSHAHVAPGVLLNMNLMKLQSGSNRLRREKKPPDKLNENTKRIGQRSFRDGKFIRNA